MDIKIGWRELIWSFGGVAASLLSNIVMIPLMIYFLDGETLGLWYVYQSLGAIAILFDFGFSPSFARNIAYAWSGAAVLSKIGVVRAKCNEVNYVLLNKLLCVCRRIYLIVAVFAFSLCATLGTYYVLHLTGGKNGTVHLASWLIYSAAIFLNLYYGYYIGLLRGVGAVVHVNRATVIARFVQLAVLIFLLIFDQGILAASVAYLLYGFSFRWLAKKAFYHYQGIGKHLAEIGKCIPKDEIWEQFRIIWPNAYKDGIVALSEYMFTQAGTIICSLFLPLNQVASYALSVQLTGAVATIAFVVYTAYQPSLQQAYVRGDMQKIRETVSVILCSYSFLFLIGIAMLLIAFIPLLGTIKSDTSLPLILVFYAGIYQFFLKLRNCYTCYLSCTNRIIYMPAFVCTAIGCIVLSFFMTGFCGLGVFGLITAQIVSHCMFNLWKWPVYVHKELNLTIRDMFSFAANNVRGLRFRKQI